MSTRKKEKKLWTLFGALGIDNEDDTIDFEKKSVELKDKLAEYPQFKTFFEIRLKERINSFVNVPRRHNKEMSEKLWTNNNAESINHVFKIATNWKPQSTPELINKLYDCVDIQFHHLRGALHFSGDYMLIPGQEHYRIPDQLWRCKTSEEKNDIFSSFLHDKKRKRTYFAMISSTDRTYAVPNKAKMIAKKPGQRKKPRTEKTQKRKKKILIFMCNKCHLVYIC